LFLLFLVAAIYTNIVIIDYSRLRRLLALTSILDRFGARARDGCFPNLPFSVLLDFEHTTSAQTLSCRYLHHHRFNVHSKRNAVTDNAPLFRSYERVGRFSIFGSQKGCGVGFL